jgi:hypothetical protein
MVSVASTVMISEIILSRAIGRSVGANTITNIACSPSDKIELKLPTDMGK